MRSMTSKTYGRVTMQRLAELISTIAVEAAVLSLWLAGFTLILWLVLATVASRQTGMPIFNFFPDFVR